MVGNFGDQIIQVVANLGAFDGGRQPIGESTQLGFLFHQHHLIPLVGHPQSRIHSGNPAADYQAPLNHRNSLFFQGMQGVGPGH